MPAHKMISIDGVRYRPEDAARLAARARTRVLSLPEPAFDPGEHTVPEVLVHLDAADAAETARVLAAELAGKNRKMITERGDGS